MEQENNTHQEDRTSETPVVQTDAHYPSEKRSRRGRFVRACVVCVALFVVAGAAYILRGKPDGSNSSSNNQNNPSINSYQECVDAGYPVMESYPEQCATPDGRTFVNERSVLNISPYDAFCATTEIEHFKPSDDSQAQGTGEDYKVFSYNKSQYAYATIDPESPHIGLQDVVVGDSEDSEKTILSKTQDTYDDGLTPIMFNTANDLLYAASKTQSSHGGGRNKVYGIGLIHSSVVRFEPDDPTEGHMNAFAKSCELENEKIAYAQSAPGGYGMFGPPTQLFYGDSGGVKNIYTNAEKDVNAISSLYFTDDRKALLFTLDRLMPGELFNEAESNQARARTSLWMIDVAGGDAVKIFEADEKYLVVGLSIGSDSDDNTVKFTVKGYIEAEQTMEGPVLPKGEPETKTYTYDLKTKSIIEN